MRDIAGARELKAAIAIVADDLTGAADTGAAFAAAGFATVVTWQIDDLAGAVRQVDALAIDAGTRALDEAQASARTAHIASALRTAGVGAIYKKGDSLLRGHIGAETAAMIKSWHDGAVAIAAFAFPDAGRVTVRGRQCVGTPGRDVRVNDSDRLAIAPLFERPGLTVRSIELDIVRSAGLDDVVRRAADRRAVIVFDAATNADLARIVKAGEAVDGSVVWVGTGGLARALAASMRRDAKPPAIAPAPRRGPVIVVCGSASPVARRQVARVAANGATAIEVAAATLRAPATAERERVAQDIGALIDRGRDVVVYPAESGDSIDPAIAHALGDLVSPTASRVSGAALTGGDTATAVLRAWGVTGLRIVDEIEPGVPLSVSEGAHQIAIVTKAGAFGSPDVLVTARDRLHAKVSDAREAERLG